MSRENAIQLILKKAAHSYSGAFSRGLKTDSSAAVIVAIKVPPENSIASQKKSIAP
jgi:hypothetical protein